ncbi:beta-galactosidase [Acrocarpospora pleiomorpha]|uniref:Beta-galactosidase n=1 Tax=Acrocarpospora pleiomorpha TaxID=90975 RepID=A0A5M3XRE6_9ACTN|nr:beta-galactosidase [Acrocarpospora pleiomorpha]GES23804.1 beta-galactosidase [Acrocarpospora pleiomorpha]
MRYGGDYNPEQWPEEVWHEDVALMCQASVNLVTVGVFSWSRLEPVEGEYDFGWLDRVLDLLAANDIQVNLATPTASPPPWFSLAYPDALTVTADGVRLTHGSRDTYCVSALPYRTAAKRMATALAGRYGEHPALAMWHVHNEYGTWCHCDHVAGAFREWLRRRYGALDVLNEAWTADFWSQRYSDWAQITPPRKTQYLANPAQLLDFRRFLSDEMLACYVEQRDILRPTGVPVTTNFVFGGWVPADHWRWAEEVDLVAIDDYPSGNAEEESAFAADLARSWARGRPWLLMEQAAGVRYTGGRMIPKEPGALARHSMQHIARGSQGVMFFQWRASRGGAEQWHHGMVPHAGPSSRTFQEISALGKTLTELPDHVPGIDAKVAILWDYEAWWALQSPGLPSPDLDYLKPIRQAHRTLWRRGIIPDFAHPSDDISQYETILVPSLYLITSKSAANLTTFVQNGGTLIVSYFTALANEHCQVHLNGHPGALRHLLGISIDEFTPLTEPIPLLANHATPNATPSHAHSPDPNPLLPQDGDPTWNVQLTGMIWSENVRLVGAEAVVTYSSGTPAITRNRYGAGTAWYLSTQLDDDGYAALLTAAGLPVASAPPGVEVIRHRDGTVYAINHTKDAVHGIAPNPLPPGGFAIFNDPCR